MSNLVHRLAFGTPKFYIAPYGKIKHRLVSLSSNYDVKAGLNEQMKTLLPKVRVILCSSPLRFQY